MCGWTPTLGVLISRIRSASEKVTHDTPIVST
jgi:hypothetical protein